MKHETTLSIRITTQMSDALKERERLTDVPVSRFVRRAIAEALDPLSVDAGSPDAADLKAMEHAAREEGRP
jgi:hypothetical protein